MGVDIQVRVNCAPSAIILIQPISPIDGVELIGQADITRSATHAEIKRRLAGRQLDAIVSDMAPDATGRQNKATYSEQSAF